MHPFDVFIAYVAWGDDGKMRPVLVYSHKGDAVFAFRITTKYDNKSHHVKAKYFAINDWAQAGLHQPSFVDTGSRVKNQRSISYCTPFRPIFRHSASIAPNKLVALHLLTKCGSWSF